MQGKLGKNIARLRKEKGWSQSTLAQKLNVSDSTVSAWENGKGSPDSHVERITDVFNVSYDTLFGVPQRNHAHISETRPLAPTKSITYKQLSETLFDYQDIVFLVAVLMTYINLFTYRPTVTGITFLTWIITAITFLVRILTGKTTSKASVYYHDKQSIYYVYDETKITFKQMKKKLYGTAL